MPSFVDTDYFCWLRLLLSAIPWWVTIFLAGFEFSAAVCILFPGVVVVSVIYINGEFDPGSG